MDTHMSTYNPTKPQTYQTKGCPPNIFVAYTRADSTCAHQLSKDSLRSEASLVCSPQFIRRAGMPYLDTGIAFAYVEPLYPDAQ